MSSTATTGSTGTQKSCATLNTTLTTIPETEPDLITRAHTQKLEPETRREKARDKQWVFQGKVQGSIVFRQYYPEAVWIVFTDIVMRDRGNFVSLKIFRFRKKNLVFRSLSVYRKTVKAKKY